MAEFTFDGYKVHYETYGDTGNPIVVLNGIMMSTGSWQPFVEDFSRHNVLVLVDLLDQGRSQTMDRQYDHSLQVKLVDELVQRLWYPNVTLMGISYGGEVALQYALAHPDKVRKLILFNTAARTSPWLKKIGDGWNEVASTRNSKAYYLSTIPIIYSTQFFADRADWMNGREEFLIKHFSDQTVMERLERLTVSSENFNVEERLGEITCPTLIVSGSEDGLIPPTEQQILHRGIPNSVYVTINGSGHASMYENPSAFAALVVGFTNLGDDGIKI